MREATEVLRASTGRAVPSHLSTAAMKAAAEMGSGAVGLATAGSTARAWADLGKIAPTLDPAIPPGLREALVRGIGQQRVSRAPARSVPGSSPRARRLAPGRRAVSAPAPSVDVKLFKVQAENSQRQLATAEATRMLLEEMVQRVRESEARAVVAEKGRTIADRRSLLVTLVIGIPSVIASMPTVVDAVKWLVRVLS